MPEFQNIGGCFQCVKVIKFESNSQLLFKTSISRLCCFQCVKVIKFESNSQLIGNFTFHLTRCFQCVKVIKFESNSQLSTSDLRSSLVVFSVSKL